MLEVLGEALGIVLAFTSLTSLSIAFGYSDVRDFINHRVSRAKTHGVILLSLLALLLLFGVLAYLTENSSLSLIGSLALGTGLLYFELWDIREFLRNKYKPTLKKDVVDVMIYSAVVWLISRHVEIPVEGAIIISVALILVAYYYSFSLGEYIKLYASVILPIDLFPTYIGSRIFSLFFAIHLISYGAFYLPFTIILLVGYCVLMYSMLLAARRIGELKATVAENHLESNVEL
ncbi:hypothetical protein Ferp_1794 [Ferroglobus placidus DSM 10642]|uniref:Uncharacterized protein n=1 Tax=Ferroglobus placidus (strain DSM 10642 / AEDII12DO) TaxID=589924 RepID=D3RZM4_FERPA|nr:hypothetical protein [Ferroglobus placidus]ADC65937.1 hypothetical protein Ferp_1794 [Ferroglobus placidus DSM 10642]